MIFSSGLELFRSISSRKTRESIQQGGVSDIKGETARVLDYRKFSPKVVGGVGHKNSNSGRQWYLQNRVYEAVIAVSVPTAFHPYYLINEERK